MVTFFFVATSQDVRERFDIDITDLPLEQILDTISNKTYFYFSYNSDILPQGSLFTLKQDQKTIKEVLDKLLVGTRIEYSFLNDQIILKKVQPVVLEAAQQTYTVSGWIRELSTNEYIPGVNVFLNGTSRGTVTNENGYYKLENIPLGNYELVFSHISYNIATYSLNIRGNGKMIVNGILEFKTNNLPALQVTADPLTERVRLRYLNIFKNEFLGNSPNASQCIILNADVLDLVYDHRQDLLSATASRPLLIRNDALGYMISYDLEIFEKQGEKLRYYGKVRFENLPNSSAKDRKKWRKNRRKSYQGSLRHFMKSLVEDRIRKEGFRMFLLEDISNITFSNLRPVNPKKILTPVGNSVEWKLGFDRYLFIQYQKEKESFSYIQYMAGNFSNSSTVSTNKLLFISRNPDIQKSIVELKDREITVDANGKIKEPLGVTSFGYWSWERFSELVPIDYDPKNDEI